PATCVADPRHGSHPPVLARAGAHAAGGGEAPDDLVEVRGVAGTASRNDVTKRRRVATWVTTHRDACSRRFFATPFQGPLLFGERVQVSEESSRIGRAHV